MRALSILIAFSIVGLAHCQSDNHIINITPPHLLKEYQNQNFKLYTLHEISKLFNLDSNWICGVDYVQKRKDKDHMYGKMVSHDFRYEFSNKNFGFSIHQQKSFDKKKQGKRFNRETFHIHELSVSKPSIENVRFLIASERTIDTLSFINTKLEDLNISKDHKKLKINSNTVMIKYNSMCRLYFKKQEDHYLLDTISFGL